MFDILFARTFLIVGAMLLITAFTARINKAFETGKEMWLTILGTFAFLFAILFFADSFPINIILIAIFSALIGWEIGPTIQHYSRVFKFRKFQKSKGIVLKKGETFTSEQLAEFEKSEASKTHEADWHKIVSQALFGTALAVFATAGTVFLTSIDFSFMGGFLFIALLILVVMGLLNVFFFKSPLFSLIKAYFGVVIFTGYLLFDFDRLEKAAGSTDWGTAVNIAVNLYLDIINLFLDLLEILASSSD